MASSKRRPFELTKADRPKFFTKTPGLSELVEYVPAYALIDGTIYHVVRIGKQIYYNQFNKTLVDNGESQVQDFFTELALGNLPNKSQVNKYGANDDVDTTAETIWSLATASSGAVTRVVPVTSGEALEIVSDSSSDDSGSTGAEKVTVYYMDGNYDYGSEEVTMDGTNAVQLTETSILHVYRMRVTQAGSGNTNAGEIAVQVTGGGAKRAIITADKGSTQMAVFPVARNYKAFMTQCSVGINNNAGNVLAEVWQHDISQSNYISVLRHDLIADVDSQVDVLHRFKPYKTFSEKTLIEMTATGSTNNIKVTGQFDLILVKVA